MEPTLKDNPINNNDEAVIIDKSQDSTISENQ